MIKRRYRDANVGIGAQKMLPAVKLGWTDVGFGEQFEQDRNLAPFSGGPGCAYVVVRLIPVAKTSQPEAITLTVTPYAAEPSKDQTVTFENLPLPPRQPVDDLRAAEVEVIEH